MLQKTQGIVLSFIKYKETSIITKIYTESFGIQSYIVNSVRGGSKGRKTSSKIAFFQPLTLLELVVYYKKPTQRFSSSLNRISEMKCPEPYQTIPYDYKKSGIAIFMAELLTKTLTEEEENPELFEFLHQSLLIFDHLTERFENFHLQFMLRVTRYLGFPPSSGKEIQQQINDAYGANMVSDLEKELLSELLQADYARKIKIDNQVRRSLLEHLILFYKLHLENFVEMKSFQVLKELMD